MATQAQKKAGVAVLLAAMAAGGGFIAKDKAVDILVEACHPSRAVVEQVRAEVQAETARATTAPVVVPGAAPGGKTIILDLRRDVGQLQSLIGRLCPTEPDSATVKDEVATKLIPGNK